MNTLGHIILRSHFQQVEDEGNISVADACKASRQHVFCVYSQLVVFLKLAKSEGTRSEKSTNLHSLSQKNNDELTYIAVMGVLPIIGLSTPL